MLLQDSTNPIDDFRRGFQRPDWMTRKNWGFLRPVYENDLEIGSSRQRWVW